MLRVAKATTSTTHCCKKRALFLLRGWFSWLEHVDASRKLRGSSPGLSLTFTEVPSSGYRLPRQQNQINHCLENRV
uniref:Secreted protein n=1 Tax=Romanomermis culicivorax TaxID=13658 RepID=A0A915J559_ROMCU